MGGGGAQEELEEGKGIVENDVILIENFKCEYY